MSIASKRVSYTQGKTTEAIYESQAEEDNESLLDSPSAPFVPALSPPSSFESFLLPLGGQELTAFAQTAFSVSSKRRVSSTRSTNESVVTDDFASAADNLSASSCELDDISFDQEDQEIIRSIYKDDILGLSKLTNPDIKEVEEITKSKMVSFSVPVVVQDKKEESQHFDMADKVYEGAKSAWAFGKGFGILKPFMNLAEGTAIKVIAIVTGVENYETVDRNLKPHVVGIDREFLDPAIVKILELVTPLVCKGDELVKSMIGVMKPAIETKADETVDPTPVESTTSAEPTPVKSPLEGVLPLFTPSPMKKLVEESDEPETSTPVAPVH
jgi:hypothetical protein